MKWTTVSPVMKLLRDRAEQWPVIERDAWVSGLGAECVTDVVTIGPDGGFWSCRRGSAYAYQVELKKEVRG